MTFAFDNKLSYLDTLHGSIFFCLVLNYVSEQSQQNCPMGFARSPYRKIDVPLSDAHASRCKLRHSRSHCIWLVSIQTIHHCRESSARRCYTTLRIQVWVLGFLNVFITIDPFALPTTEYRILSSTFSLLYIYTTCFVSLLTWRRHVSFQYINRVLLG